MKGLPFGKPLRYYKLSFKSNHNADQPTRHVASSLYLFAVQHALHSAAGQRCLDSVGFTGVGGQLNAVTYLAVYLYCHCNGVSRRQLFLERGPGLAVYVAATTRALP